MIGKSLHVRFTKTSGFGIIVRGWLCFHPENWKGEAHMAVKFNVGGEFFDRLRESGSYYVDKTELLYELAQQTENAVTLFTRPRRFGKTLTMSMIECFFNIARDNEETRKLFDGLDVMKHEEFCREWMNQYPVLFLTLKDVDGLTFESALKTLKIVVANLCKSLSVALDCKNLLPSDMEAYRKLEYVRADTEELKDSLRLLTNMMHTVYNKPVILLIDEYDVPLAKAQENGYYRQMLDVIRGLLSAAMKTNNDLKCAVVTGCLCISKESIFTGVNNFFSYSVLDEDFSDTFGFTQEEVDKLVDCTGIQEKAETFKQWYNGYIFGSTAVYCPWDVVCYASELVKRDTAQPKNYWKNTSSNGAIRTFIENREFNVQPAFETLMNGGTITRSITDQMTYDLMDKTEENLWSVLLMTGYLTKVDPTENGGTVSLRIPNTEIASIFQDTVARYFAETVQPSQVELLIDYLWKQDTDNASKVFSDLLWQTISYNDYHEDYYHAFLAGIFVGRGYSVESNKERGLGRPDIQLIDQPGRRAMIIEAKKSDSRGRMDHDADEALKQIVDNEYARNLDEYDQILCYGVSFFKKSACVKALK